VAGEVRSGALKVIPTGRVRFVRVLGAVFRDREKLSPSADAFVKLLGRTFRADRVRQ